jgi:hypothetical protein
MKKEKGTEGADIDATTCDECETLAARSSDKAESGSGWQNPRRVKRMVAGALYELSYDRDLRPNPRSAADWP